MSAWYLLLLLGVVAATVEEGLGPKDEATTNVDSVDKRSRNPYSWMAMADDDRKTRNPYSWMRQQGKRAPRNPYSWMVTGRNYGKRAVRFNDDYNRAPRNPYSWQYTMFDKRTRNPYSWMNEY